MEKFKKRYLFLIPVIIAISVILFIQIQNRTVSRNILNVSDIIYVPDGMADNYINLHSGFTDGHIIWGYKLNSAEKEKIKEDLDNGIWDKNTDEAMSEIMYYFTFNSESYLTDDISEELYFCIYDFGLKRFIGVDEDVSILGWNRALFVYDKANSQYYCVNMSI